MDLGNLKVKIGADTGELQQGLKGAETQIKTFAATVQKGSAQASNAMINLGRVVQDAPYGFIGIANNINPLLESFQRLKAETGSTKAALTSLAGSLTSGAGLGLAVSIASSLLVTFGSKLFESSKKAEDAKGKLEDYRKSVNGIFSDAAKEATQVQSLIVVLDSETATRERKLNALKELKQIQPEIFGQLKLEGDTVKGLDVAYKNYLDNLKTVIAVRIKQQQLEKVTQQILEKEGGTLTQVEKQTLDVLKAYEQKTVAAQVRSKKEQEDQKSLNRLYDNQRNLLNDIKQLQDGIKVKEFKPPPAPKPVDIKIDIPEYDYTYKRLGLIIDRLEEFRKKAEETINTLKKIPSSFKVPEVVTGATQQIDKLRSKLEKIGEVIIGSIANPMQQAFETIFSGGQNALQAFGNMIKQIVVKLVAAAATALVLSTILGAIGIGGNLAGGGFQFKSLFASLAGLPKFAKGGMVTGATMAMVGDNPSGKEAIIPFERMGEFINGVVGGGNGTQVFIPELRIRGNDQIISFRRAERAYNRTT